MTKEQVQKDLNEALRGGQELKTSVLRLVLASILNKEKEKRYALKQEKDIPLNDQEILDVILFEAKKRRDAAELYEKGGRADLAKKEKDELEVLQKYLPSQLSSEELKELVEAAIEKAGAKSANDLGRVMGILMPQVKGRVDGNIISQIVKELLTSSK